MTSPKVHVVTEVDAERAIGALTLAFATDPVVRSFYPDPFDHLKNFPEMMRINMPDAIASGTACYVDGFSAATIWFPPARTDEDVEAAKDRGRRHKISQWIIVGAQQA